jgi:hypothetical protein
MIDVMVERQLKRMEVLGMYNAYYSDEAKGLHKWALEERHRLKATRIYKVAQSVEKRFRDNHESDPYSFPTVVPPTGPPPNRGSFVIKG